MEFQESRKSNGKFFGVILELLAVEAFKLETVCKVPPGHQLIVQAHLLILLLKGNLVEVEEVEQVVIAVDLEEELDLADEGHSERLVQALENGLAQQGHSLD